MSMRSLAPKTPWRLALICSALLIGCAGPNLEEKALHDTNVIIPVVYDKDGKVIQHYVGVSDGYMATTFKECQDMLEEMERTNAVLPADRFIQERSFPASVQQ